MLQAKLYGPGDLRLEEVPLDPGSLGPNQIYVETLSTALSTGTDLGNYLGDSTYVPGAPPYPRWVGYSNVGEIRQVGPAVTAFRPGQRVFANKPHQSAYIADESDFLVPVSADVEPGMASLAYIAQLNIAALRKAGFIPGETVAVVGLGVIGLTAIPIALAMGALKVIALANHPSRAALAAKLGASTEPAESAADVVISTANTWDSWRSSMEIARRNGRVAVLGFPGRGQPQPDFNPLAPEWIYAKQLGIFGSGFYEPRRDVAYLLELMAQRRLDFNPIISHRYPARRIVEAYELAKSHDKSLTAAIFDWR